MKIMKLALLVAASCFVASEQAHAVKVVSVSGGAGLGDAFLMPTVMVGVGGTPFENNELGGAPGPNSIFLPITVLKKHVPFVLDFVVDETSVPAPINATRYTVTVELTHMVPGSPASAINGFDVEAVGAALPISHALSAPVTSTFTVEEPQPMPGGAIRYGGLNGGGTGQLLFGDTATSTFDFVLTSFASSGPITRSVVMVANPEPGSILLGSLALVPIGIAVRRRRKQQVVAE